MTFFVPEENPFPSSNTSLKGLRVLCYETGFIKGHGGGSVKYLGWSLPM